MELQVHQVYQEIVNLLNGNKFLKAKNIGGVLGIKKTQTGKYLKG